MIGHFENSNKIYEDANEYQKEQDGEFEIGPIFDQSGAFGLSSTKLIPIYNSKAYWDERYKLEEIERPYFEWYVGYSSIKEQINKFVNKEQKILEIGILSD